MENTSPRAIVAETVRQAIIREGLPAEAIAQTVEIPVAELMDRLAGNTEFTLSELADIAVALNTNLSLLFKAVD